MSVLSKTQHGQIFKCSKCTKIHIEYKNLNFNFNEKEFNHFAEYILSLDGREWEEKNENAPYERKIIIPIRHKNFHVLLNNEELNELKELLRIRKEEESKHYLKMIQLDKFSFVFNLN